MYALIVNPASGSGRGLRELPRVQALLREEGVLYKLFCADAHGDVREYAAEAVREGMTGIIAVGGDGTLFEAINGMARSDLSLLFFCCGTGNDFVKTLKLPKDPLEALRVQLRAPLSRIDIGRMNDTYFLNVSGTGLDVEVLKQAEKYKDRRDGLGVYLRGVRDAIRHFQPMRAQVSFDGEPPAEVPFSILSIGNGRYFGGGMRPVPTAEINDGMFDVVVARPVKKWMIPFLLLLFVPGFYIHTPLAKVRRVRAVRISCPGMVLNLDGELVECDDADFEILPGALRVRVPELAPSI